MRKRHENKIQCEIYVNPSLAWLKNAWTDLETRSNAGIFLSWLWIGTWIECFVKDYYVIEATQGNKTVGLGVFIKSADKFLWLPYKNKYFLHRSGVKEFDQIWIEYNDFLIDKSAENNIRSAMLEYCIYNLIHGHSLVIGASEENKFGHVQNLGLIKRTLWKTQNFALNLDSLRAMEQSILQYLSRNTRYQILRSIRKYEREYGSIRIEKAINLHQAKDMLMLAKPLHLARWSRKQDKSGFANSAFIDFHERLIEKGIESNNVELYHIKAGNTTLSVMYNYKYNNQVYFYLCAINYQNNSSQLKPGLVSHYLLIDKALKEGVSLYDFMGGSSRYKKSFSNIEGQLEVNAYETYDWTVNLGLIFRDYKSKLINRKKEKKIKTIEATC